MAGCAIVANAGRTGAGMEQTERRERERRRQRWRVACVGLAAAWCASIGLFLAGVLAYPWGWLVLLVLLAWCGYRLRSMA